MRPAEFVAGFVAGVCAVVGAATLITAMWIALTAWWDYVTHRHD